MSLRVITFVNGKWNQNCYIVVNNEQDVLIIDPGSKAEEIAMLVDGHQWRVHAILSSHGHYDHIGAVAELVECYNVPFYLHGGDELLLKNANLYRWLFESREAVRIPLISHDISSLAKVFQVGPFDISWISTPGHTEGSVCLVIQDFLFSGDTLMQGALGRTDLPGGNRGRLVSSVRKLMDLPGEMIVCGGHGERTTIEVEFSRGSRVWSLIQ